ncbi:MAG: nitrogen regulation protein NR(I) [Alphaproteobacteria bacterium]|nr:nitrogen regulation protein NR(I) [Alphaproteobacteria bacterium]
MTPTILIADDDKAICTVLSHAVRRRGWDLKVAHHGGALMEWVEEGVGDVVITDVRMPVAVGFSDGLDMLPEIARLRPDLPVIVISAQNTLSTAVRANAAQAYEYMPKPFDLNVLMEHVEKALEKVGKIGQQEAEVATQEAEKDAEHFIGSSPAMQEIYRTLARMVGNDLTVTVIGESGTGKELVARALHQLGKRKSAPFVAVNMAAIPRELVESELFGYEKGAFTGATQRKSGKFEQAEGGTLFLDEIGDMPMDAQTKLLRVLQQGEYTTVGGTRMIKTSVRIVCATHRDLMQMVRDGAFREDLYYRLNVVPIRIPPLRERKQDIAPLASYFLRKAAQKGLSPKILDSEAIAEMELYDWPGNVRELENMMYRLCALYSESIISRDSFLAEMPVRSEAMTSATTSTIEKDVQAHLKHYFSAHTGDRLPPPGLYDRILPLVEKPLIEMTLAATHGNQLKAAFVLGINRNTLRKKITELGVKVSGAREQASDE